MGPRKGSKTEAHQVHQEDLSSPRKDLARLPQVTQGLRWLPGPTEGGANSQEEMPGIEDGRRRLPSQETTGDGIAVPVMLLPEVNLSLPSALGPQAIWKPPAWPFFVHLPHPKDPTLQDLPNSVK